MNLPAQLFPGDLLWLANAVFAVLLGKALWRASWRDLLRSEARLQALIGLLIGLFVFWQMSAGIRPGFHFHLLGATLFVLLFGWQVALSVISLVMMATFWRIGMDPLSLGLNGLLMVALPVYFSEAVLRFSQRFLPKNLFMFVIGNGFLCGGLAMLLTVLTAAVLLAVFTRYTWGAVLHNYLIVAPVIALTEAFACGALIAAFTVFSPQCVLNFSDKDYINGK
jgi:uncharacterized membrane protein